MLTKLIHHKLAESLDYNEVINEFVTVKTKTNIFKLMYEIHYLNHKCCDCHNSIIMNFMLYFNFNILDRHTFLLFHNLLHYLYNFYCSRSPHGGVGRYAWMCLEYGAAQDGRTYEGERISNDDDDLEGNYKTSYLCYKIRYSKLII